MGSAADDAAVALMERWDVVVEVLDGPMASAGAQRLQGPVVPMGVAPGAGGFAFAGYRGLESRHAVITAYDAGEASISAVGTAQVRVSPHPHVRWDDIQPLAGPRALNEGCAVHLGPPGRGVTLQFHGVERLGSWEGGQLASAGAPAGHTHAVRRVGTGNRRVFAVVGSLVVSAIAFSACVLVALLTGPGGFEPLGPVTEGEAYYEFARLDDEPLSPSFESGLEQALWIFVMEENERLSGRRLSEPEEWDRLLVDYTAQSVEQHVRSWAVFRRLDDVRDDYAMVLGELRDAGLPEVFAAIPYLESRYRPGLQSSVCAKGYWQWMPESGPRFAAAGIDFEVSGCRFRDAPDFLYTPSDATPPRKVRTADYVLDEETLSKGDPALCRIERSGGCAVDSRTLLGPSTQAAVIALSQAMDDPLLRESGAAVQMAIGSHHAGYDDAQFGVAKRYNMLPAFKRWAEDRPRDEWHRFYGANIACADVHGASNDFCGAVLSPGTQHYAYTVIAQHLVAACYYGLNYGSEEAFAAYRPLTRGDGYCTSLGIPSADEVQARSGRGGSN